VRQIIELAANYEGGSYSAAAYTQGIQRRVSGACCQVERAGVFFMPGPKATPNEIKSKRGTLRNRGQVVQIKAQLPRLADAARPTDLGPIASEAYERILTAAGEWLAVSDLDAVAMLAKAIERHTDLAARLMQDGPVLYTDKGYAYAHPAAGMLSTTEDSIRKWTASLGLTASDRVKLGLVMVESRSKLEEFARRAREA
jgi:P27 family predicted phage terminase small subunit